VLAVTAIFGVLGTSASANDMTGDRGDWSHNDFDVFDGEREVGRIYLIDKLGDEESWFWDVSFMLTGRASYGRAYSLDGAKAAFRAEYEAWLREAGDGQQDDR
jgi:hypothetical protein